MEIQNEDACLVIASQKVGSRNRTPTRYIDQIAGDSSVSR